MIKKNAGYIVTSSESVQRSPYTHFTSHLPFSLFAYSTIRTFAWIYAWIYDNIGLTATLDLQSLLVDSRFLLEL
jgi:hypothetical protein